MVAPETKERNESWYCLFTFGSFIEKKLTSTPESKVVRTTKNYYFATKINLI